MTTETQQRRPGAKALKTYYRSITKRGETIYYSSIKFRYFRVSSETVRTDVEQGNAVIVPYYPNKPTNEMDDHAVMNGVELGIQSAIAEAVRRGILH